MTYSVKRTIIKNFSSMIAAQIFYKVVTFLMMVVMARFLGPKEFGQFSFGFSFVWIFLFISDFGLAELFIRDVSLKADLLKKYMNNILTLKLYIALTAYLVLIILAWRYSFGVEKFWLIILLGASLILDSFMYFFRCIFRVKGTMEYEGGLMVVEAAIKFLVIFVAINLGIGLPGAILIAASLLLVSVLNVFINLTALLSCYHQFSFAFDAGFYRYLLKTSFPFALIYILSLLNFRIDIIMLSLMRGDVAAGWYNASFKLIEQFILIPITLSAVYLPVFSKFSESTRNLHAIAKKTLWLLLVISAALVVLLFIFGGFSVKIIYGDKFAEAGRYIFVLSLVLIPFFIKPITEKLLYAMKKQFIVCAIYASGVSLNVVLNFLMIPRWGINGSSLATVISEVLTVALSVFVYKRLYSISIERRNLLEAEMSFIGNEALY